MKIKSPKYKILLLTLVLLACGIAALYILFSDKKVSVKMVGSIKRLQFVPESMPASNQARIQIDAAKGCFLKINSGWGTQIINLQTNIILPASITTDAGIHHLSIWCGFKNMENKTLEVRSIATQGEMDSYIGSKSIPADNGMHWSMFTTLPTDRFRNMVSDSTSIKIDMIRPTGDRTATMKPTKNGIAYIKILSNSQIGKTIISSSSKFSHGKEKELLELPNFPVSVSLNTERNILYADNRQFFKVLTNELRDKYGNRVADGTLVKFKVEDSQGNLSYYRSFSTDGIVSLNIQNPDYPGPIKIVAYIDNLLLSTLYQLNFEPYVTSIEARQKNSLIEIGPVLGPLNQLVSDGKEIAISFLNSKQEITAILKNGKTKVEIPKGVRKGETVVISVGGIKKKLILT